MNADDLTSLADRASTVQGRGPQQRLADVHARIRTTRRRRTLASAGALLLVVALGGVALSRSLWVEDAIGPSGRTPTPSTTDAAVSPGSRIGFIGLPPEGATPSGGNSAELVLHYLGRDPSGAGRSYLWAYDDGRVIFVRGVSLPEGANATSTGYLERRLTPEGVETLRSQVLSNGKPPPKDPPVGMSLQVRDGERLVDLDPTVGVDVAGLMDRADWLSESAWEHQEPRAYVPSSFAACYGSTPQVARSRLLEPLPDPAANLLRTGSEPAPFPPADGSSHCSVVTTEDARTIVGWLQGAGLSQGDSTYNLNYWFEVGATPDQPDPPEARIWFEPVLPDGQSTCSECG